MSENSWHAAWLDVARRISLESKDPSTKVGCVLTDENNFIIGTGVNGSPSGYDYQSADDRYATTLHAEENALRLVGHRNPHTAYVFPCFPCSNCMARLAQHGIKRVFSIEAPGERWRFDLTEDIAKAKGIELIRLY